MISDPLPKLLQPQNMSFYPLQHLRIHDLKNIDKCQRTRTYIPIPANPQFFQDIEEYLDQICDTTPTHRTRHLLKNCPSNCYWCYPNQPAPILHNPLSLKDLTQHKLTPLYRRADSWLTEVTGRPSQIHLPRLYQLYGLPGPNCPYRNLVSLPNIHNFYLTHPNINIDLIRSEYRSNTYGSLDSLLATRKAPATRPSSPSN